MSSIHVLYFLGHAAYFWLYLDDVMRVFEKLEGQSFWTGILVGGCRLSVRKRKLTNYSDILSEKHFYMINGKNNNQHVMAKSVCYDNID